MDIVTADEFLALKIEPRSDLLAPWLQTQGLALLYGERGLGKTFLALSIAVAVSGAGNFLNWEAVRPHGVLYIDGEMPGRILQDRLKLVMSTMDDINLKATLKIVTPDTQSKRIPNLSTTDGQQAIEAQLNNIELIIIDNISTLFGTNENQTSAWKPIQEWALKLRSQGYAILFVHHSGKNGTQRGSSSREDVLDVVIQLIRADNYSMSEGARFDIHFRKGRCLCGDDVKSFGAHLTYAKGRPTWVRKRISSY